MREPICLKHRDGLVRARDWARQSERLFIDGRSSSACVEERELVNKRSSWARLHE